MCDGGSDDGSSDAVGSEEDPNTFGGDDPTGNTGGQTDQNISDPTSISDTSVDDVGSEEDPSVNSSLSDAAINSANTDQSQSADSQSYFASNAVPNAMDFNFANSQSAQNVRDNKNQGSVFRDPQNPFSYAINALSKIGPQNTYNNLSMGQVPTYNAQGQITGTTGQGFGANQTQGYIGGLANNQPGIIGGLNTAPQVQSFDNTINDGSDNNDPEIIRRRMAGEVIPEEELDPVLSDDLAVNYLQNPYYLYSGQGNLYQPYGYAQNTLVDLLRTRNLTQPQQRAANLGLFGNPGDFS